MASENMGLVPSQRLDNGLGAPLVFQDDPLRFNCSAAQPRRIGDPGPKTRELSGFIDDKMFAVERDRYFHPQAAEYRRSIYGDAPEPRDCPETQSWNGNGSAQTPSGEGSEEDEDEDDDDDDDDDEVDEGDGEVEGLVVGNKNSNNTNNSNGSVHSSADKIGNETGRHHSSFVGSSREVMMKDGNVQSVNNARESTSENHQLVRLDHYQNPVTIAAPNGDMYFSQFIQGSESSAPAQKHVAEENGFAVSGRKEVLFSNESRESLRTILSDPLTGALMDDAMILHCGHSFGGGGMQHVLEMKACCTCSHPISEDSVQPNLTLRAAVQAFRREEELHSHRASKRRRERFEDKVNYGDSTLTDAPRGRGVQFPFAVTDRVIIKGNKRTPQRFVGREAVVTTQCLNGWYVVKTLDNAESVKLQYRSLAKVSDNPSSKQMSNSITPNWL